LAKDNEELVPKQGTTTRISLCSPNNAEPRIEIAMEVSIKQWTNPVSCFSIHFPQSALPRISYFFHRSIFQGRPLVTQVVINSDFSNAIATHPTPYFTIQ
jgi:hypothetical protein